MNEKITFIAVFDNINLEKIERYTNWLHNKKSSSN